MNFCKATPFKLTEPLMESHYAEPNIKGVRMALVFDGTKGKPFMEPASKAGISFRDAACANDVIKELEHPLIIEDVVLDGVLAGSVFNAFDVLPLDSWFKQATTVPLHYRKSVLASIMMVGEFKRTVFVPTTHVHTQSDIDTVCRKQRNLGFKGIVLKVIDSEYTFGPTDDWKYLTQSEKTSN